MLLQKLVYVSQVGASVVLYVLLFLSVVSVGVIVERWWYFRRRKFDLVEASRALQVKLRNRDVAGARKELKAQRAVEASIVEEALASYDDGPDSVQEMLQAGIRQRRKSYEGGLLFLGTLGNNAPFVGLFGTVLGVVSAFRELGNASASAAQGGGMGNVMSGIAEALVATAIGILVALPAVIAYNMFQKRGGDLEENTYAMGNIVIAAMKSKLLGTNGRRDHHDRLEQEEPAGEVGRLTEAEA